MPKRKLNTTSTGTGSDTGTVIAAADDIINNITSNTSTVTAELTATTTTVTATATATQQQTIPLLVPHVRGQQQQEQREVSTSTVALTEVATSTILGNNNTASTDVNSNDQQSLRSSHIPSQGRGRGRGRGRSSGRGRGRGFQHQTTATSTNTIETPSTTTTNTPFPIATATAAAAAGVLQVTSTTASASASRGRKKRTKPLTSTCTATATNGTSTVSNIITSADTGTMTSLSSTIAAGTSTTSDTIQVQQPVRVPRNVLVLDNGSDTIRYGWASLSSMVEQQHTGTSTIDVPYTISNVTCHLQQKQKYSSKHNNQQSSTLLIGDQVDTVLQSNPNTIVADSITYSTERGIITNMYNQILVWKRILDILKIQVPVVSSNSSSSTTRIVLPNTNTSTSTTTSTTTTKIQSNDCIVLIGLSIPYYPRCIVEQIINVWIHEFNFNRIGFTLSSIGVATFTTNESMKVPIPLQVPLQVPLSAVSNSTCTTVNASETMKTPSELNAAKASDADATKQKQTQNHNIKLPTACIVDIGWSSIRIVPTILKYPIVKTDTSLPVPVVDTTLSNPSITAVASAVTTTNIPITTMTTTTNSTSTGSSTDTVHSILIRPKVSIRRINIGLKHIVTVFKYFCTYRQWNMMSNDNDYLIKNILQQVLFVSTNYYNDMNIIARKYPYGLRYYDLEYILPDYHTNYTGTIQIPLVLQKFQEEQQRKQQKQQLDDEESEDDDDDDDEDYIPDEYIDPTTGKGSSSADGGAGDDIALFVTEDGEVVVSENDDSDEDDDNDDDDNDNDKKVDNEKVEMKADNQETIKDEEKDDNKELSVLSKKKQLKEQFLREQRKRKEIELQQEQQQILKLSVERFALTEALLFRPSDIGVATDWCNVSQAIVSSISSCPIVYHGPLYSTIVLCGSFILSQVQVQEKQQQEQQDNENKDLSFSSYSTGTDGTIKYYAPLLDRLHTELQSLVPCEYSSMIRITIASSSSSPQIASIQSTTISENDTSSTRDHTMPDVNDNEKSNSIDNINESNGSTSTDQKFDRLSCIDVSAWYGIVQLSKSVCPTIWSVSSFEWIIASGHQQQQGKANSKTSKSAVTTKENLLNRLLEMNKDHFV